MADQRLEWLKPRMDELFEKKARLQLKEKDFSKSIQSGREFRNPRICEKLIENLKIAQYGSNMPKEQFDPDSWRKKEEVLSRSGVFRKMAERRELEKQQQSRSQHHSSHHHSHHHHHHSSK